MTDATRTCSFCLRSAAEVDRLLAGAAGHICDTCVAACDRILADPSIPFPSMEAETDQALLDRLPAADRNVASADAGLRGLVGLLRDRGVSWARIGEALGVSRQAAWQRFG